MHAEYGQNANSKWLVLRFGGNILNRIPIERVAKYACDHDYLISDCGRCVDCGIKREKPS